jgi:hypothetical protein
MTVLIAWGALSVGIVIGAMWRSICEKQSKDIPEIEDGIRKVIRLSAGPDRQGYQHSGMEDRRRHA